MHLCYMDESGTPEPTGNTSHYVLAGLSIPIYHWGDADREVSKIKKKYELENSEVHTAWILRPYYEQKLIPNFDSLSYSRRRMDVSSLRHQEILKCQRLGNKEKLKQLKKSFNHTDAYIHLSLLERKSLIKELAGCVSNWGFARLFAECIDKTFPVNSNQKNDEQAFEQLVSRFEQFLDNISIPNPKVPGQKTYGLLIHDHNQTVCKKHTDLMKNFHKNGTFWTEIKHIIETPLFVDSELTSMVQVADLCAYALRRYLENGEQELFDLIFARADRKPGMGGTPGATVGVRHFTRRVCSCIICSKH